MTEKMTKNSARRKKPSSSSRKRRASHPSAKPYQKMKATLKKWLFRLSILLTVVAVLAIAALDFFVRQGFEGKRWAIPAKIYARPLELYEGLTLTAEQLEQELIRLRYISSTGKLEPGSYRRRGKQFEFYTRGFQFLDGVEAARRIGVTFTAGQVRTIYLSGSRNKAPVSMSLLRLEPMTIGGFYPSHNEDRELVRLDQLPPILVSSLLAVEDRDFFNHHGIAWRGIARALLVNLKAGRIEQGGSTLTQQLAKNFYLSSERSYVRKAVEVLIALLFELHYSKEAILETYLNEIYLGQNGNKGIHGVGLAGSYYFGRSPEHLKLHQLALLVGIIKGPSYYNPRRFPERAIKRRNQVLGILKEQGVIDSQQFQRATKQPLGLVSKPRSNSAFPAYLDLVKRQLRRDYQEQDLRSEGLRIFTSLNPFVQEQAEKKLVKSVRKLENVYKMPEHSLQSAVVITSADGGEVVALIGGRDVKLPGFNRALDAVRPIGSLLKPAIYLSALEDYKRYHWGSLIDDAPIIIDAENNQQWAPRNYDRKSHGEVTLLEALSHSYNQAAARLGMNLGLSRVLDTVKRLGISRDLPAYPAVLLGGTGLAPIEVAAMYQTIAAGGFYSPLRAIREVLDVQGRPLVRYPLTVEQRFEPQAVALLTEGLKEVMRSGTGRSIYSVLPEHIDVAGKTGTTNGLRDSWFAGFSENYVTVVWAGRDDNEKTPLTGASGALHIWGQIVSQLDIHSLAPYKDEKLQRIWYDPVVGLRSGENCPGALQITMHLDSIPAQWTACGRGNKVINRIKSWFH